MYLARKSTLVAVGVAAGLGATAQLAQAQPVEEMQAVAPAQEVVETLEIVKPETAIASQLIIEQDADLTTASAAAIPFEPPIVLRGWPTQNGQMLRGPLRPEFLGQSRDLLFRPEDRRTFKAMHPFLRTEPQVVPVIRAPQLELEPAAPQAESAK